MKYIDFDTFKEVFGLISEHAVSLCTVEKQGYFALHDMCSRGELTDDFNSNTRVQFVVMFRTVNSNLIAVKDMCFAIPVDVANEEIPNGATFDDMILLHGKKFIDSYVTTQDIQKFISYTTIQPWGTVWVGGEVSDIMYVPIEIIVSDKMLNEGVFSLTGDLVNDNNSDKPLLNGFNPIQKVIDYYSKVNPKNSVIDVILSKSLKVVKTNE